MLLVFNYNIYQSILWYLVRYTTINQNSKNRCTIQDTIWQLFVAFYSDRVGFFFLVRGGGYLGGPRGSAPATRSRAPQVMHLLCFKANCFCQSFHGLRCDRVGFNFNWFWYVMGLQVGFIIDLLCYGSALRVTKVGPKKKIMKKENSN